MDEQTITKLAKAHATLIMQYTGVSQVEAISIAGKIIQFIAGGNLGAGESATYTSNFPTPAPDTHPKGSQDAPGEGAVLARPGYHCYCSSCKTDIYELIAEIRGKGMGVNAFCQAFRPIGNIRGLTRDDLDVLKTPEGGTYIDCPSCKGVKTLQILGERVKQPVSPTTSATTIRQEDFK